MQLLWKLAQEQGIAICPLVSAEFLPGLDEMAAQFPKVTCVIDHLGHVESKDSADVANLLRLARHRNVHIKLSAFYKLGARKPPYTDLAPLIRRLVEAFGPQRLMWGGDCPYQLQNGHTYHDSIELIRTRSDFLSAADGQAILRDTAHRVFFG